MSIAASLPDGTLRRVYPDRTEDIRGRGRDVWFDTEIALERRGRPISASRRGRARGCP